MARIVGAITRLSLPSRGSGNLSFPQDRPTAVKHILPEVLHLKDSGIRPSGQWLVEMRLDDLADNDVVVALFKVLEGEVDHRDKRLSPEQREAEFFLACVSRAKGDLLVLDL